jgi:hypothetical protein
MSTPCSVFFWKAMARAWRLEHARLRTSVHGSCKTGLDAWFPSIGLGLGKPGSPRASPASVWICLLSKNSRSRRVATGSMPAGPENGFFQRPIEGAAIVTDPARRAPPQEPTEWHAVSDSSPARLTLERTSHSALPNTAGPKMRAVDITFARTAGYESCERGWKSSACDGDQRRRKGEASARRSPRRPPPPAVTTYSMQTAVSVPASVQQD